MGIEYPVSEESYDAIMFDVPIELAPQSTFFFTVGFTPMDDSKAEGTLVIYSNDPDQGEGKTVLVIGNKTGPCITVNPQEVDFHGQKTGSVAVLPLEIQSCGDAPLEIFDLDLATGSSLDFQIDTSTLPHHPEPGNPVVVPIAGSVTVNVTYTPDVDDPIVDGVAVGDTGTLIITNNSFYEEKPVELSGHGSKFVCPTAIIDCAEGLEVKPQTVLHLYGDQSFATEGTITKWDWSVEQPVLSASVFIPSSSFPNPTFQANTAGIYKFELMVYDALNVASCEKDILEVMVIPDEAIHIELLWNTPQDSDQTDEGPEAGADLDLHFTHPFAGGPDIDGDGVADGWFHMPFDCFWWNTQPEWGSFDPGVDDNPGLDRDDTDGAGPENINLNIPEDDTTYKVGVHYWKQNEFGPSWATVRVYIYSQLVFEIADVKLVEYDMWEVCTIDWKSGIVTAITDAQGQYKIIPDYPPGDLPQ